MALVCLCGFVGVSVAYIDVFNIDKEMTLYNVACCYDVKPKFLFAKKSPISLDLVLNLVKLVIDTNNNILINSY